MTTRRLTIVLMGILLLGALGCSGKLSPTTMMAPSPQAEAEYKERLTLKQIDELQPQLQFPIHLAVSQPTSGSGWSREEIELIESWLPELQSAGFADELTVLPESLADSCGWRMSYNCGILRDRRTAARFHADALLLLSAQTEVKSRANPLSILNLTVVGLWLAPGHNRTAETVLEGSLVDNRNEYLYAFARAHGRAKIVRPYLFADRDRVVAESRSRALEEFGRRMLTEVGKHRYSEAP